MVWPTSRIHEEAVSCSAQSSAQTVLCKWGVMSSPDLVETNTCGQEAASSASLFCFCAMGEAQQCANVPAHDRIERIGSLNIRVRSHLERSFGANARISGQLGLSLIMCLCLHEGAVGA